jgi:ABC-2 type transport system ATP-binding protein
MAQPILQIENLGKRFAEHDVLSDVSLSVAKGSVYGLLGPNGAGKTTLLRIVMGLVAPTSGTVRLLGDLEPGDSAARRLLGYMPQQLALYQGLSARENLYFFGRLYGLTDDVIQERAAQLLDLVDLEPHADHIVSELSGGLARRAMLASALIHEPRLLILDEPTAGVDPALRVRFWKWFRKLVDGGTTIIITTHHIAEARDCEAVVFMREGRIIQSGSPAELMRSYEALDLEEAFVRATSAEPPS